MTFAYTQVVRNPKVPAEVIANILSYCHGSSLLNFALHNKKLHGILTARNTSSLIWAKSRIEHGVWALCQSRDSKTEVTDNDEEERAEEHTEASDSAADDENELVFYKFPSPPPDISELRYAYILWGSVCSFCDSKDTAPWLAFALRLCQPCAREK